MTQNEIIEMARQAGLVFNENLGTEKARQIHLTRVDAFAKRVADKAAAKEREVCANLMFEIDLCGQEMKAANVILAGRHI